MQELTNSAAIFDCILSFESRQDRRNAMNGAFFDSGSQEEKNKRSSDSIFMPCKFPVNYHRVRIFRHPLGWSRPQAKGQSHAFDQRVSC